MSVTRYAYFEPSVAGPASKVRNEDATVISLTPYADDWLVLNLEGLKLAVTPLLASEGTAGAFSLVPLPMTLPIPLFFSSEGRRPGLVIKVRCTTGAPCAWDLHQTAILRNRDRQLSIGDPELSAKSIGADECHTPARQDKVDGILVVAPGRSCSVQLSLGKYASEEALTLLILGLSKGKEPVFVPPIHFRKELIHKASLR
jgi:hypothetical protein